MVLGQGLEDASGARHEMAGLLGLETSFATRKMQLGYRRAVLLSDCPIGLKGSVIAGHEFHYATITSLNDDALAEIADADGNKTPQCGSSRGNVTGSFFHMVDQIS